MKNVFTEKFDFFGNRELTIENNEIAIKILPEVGGRIANIYDKKKNFNYLLKLDKNPADKKSNSYDEVFSGGFDEMFPNDSPMFFDGIEYTDHGWLWNSVMEYSFDGEAIQLSGITKNSLIRQTKRISLKEKTISYSLELTNISEKDIGYIHRLHPAFYIDSTTKLIIDAGLTYPESGYNSHISVKDNYLWPHLPISEDKTRDMSVFNDSADDEIVFQSAEMNSGNFSVFNGEKKCGVRFSYDINVFPYLTYFGSFGGFSGIKTSIIEPSTTLMSDFFGEIKENRVRKIKSKETISYTLEINVFHE